MKNLSILVFVSIEYFMLYAIPAIMAQSEMTIRYDGLVLI